MREIYKVADIVSLGLHSLLVHLGRSALTALGIVFAVWSVIAMLAINEGFSYESQRQLRELGSDNIIVTSRKPATSDTGAGSSTYGFLSYGIKHLDVARFKDNIPNVRRCVTVHRTIKDAFRSGQKKTRVAVLATEPRYTQVARTVLTAGRFISDTDMLHKLPHCVITLALARRLFDYEDPLGQTFRVGPDDQFTIVGVLAHLPQALVGPAGDVEDCVIIPRTTGLLRFGEYTAYRTKGERTYEWVEVSQAILQMTDERAVVEGAQVARSLLVNHHQEDDYEVKVPQELMDQMKKQQELWNIMFLMIASISLIVGGIGIVNIMLASVTERTREIGVRRALGAKQRDIVAQFLVESVTLTTIGGILGIGIGLMVPWLVERVLALPTIITPVTLVLPLVMAIVVGLVAGLYPAIRAARLDPIVALRHE